MFFKGISDETKAKLIRRSERIYKKPQGDFEIIYEKSDCFEVSKKGDKLFVKYEDDSEL